MINESLATFDNWNKVDGKTNVLCWVVLEVNIYIFYCSIATNKDNFLKCAYSWVDINETKCLDLREINEIIEEKL